MSRPRISRIPSSSSSSRSLPSKVMRPLEMWPVSRGRRRMMESADTDLPEPDSPTMATTSPRPTWKLRPSTARTMPREVSKWTCRSSTSSKAEAPSVRTNTSGCASTPDPVLLRTLSLYRPGPLYLIDPRPTNRKLEVEIASRGGRTICIRLPDISCCARSPGTRRRRARPFVTSPRTRSQHSIPRASGPDIPWTTASGTATRVSIWEPRGRSGHSIT